MADTGRDALGKTAPPHFYALTAHFGQWVRIEGKRKPKWVVSAELLYGQVKKFYRRRRIVNIERRMQWGELADLEARLKSLGLTEHRFRRNRA